MHNQLPETNLKIPMPDCKPPKEDKADLETKIVFDYDGNGKVKIVFELPKDRLDYLLSRGVDIYAFLDNMARQLFDVLN